MSAEATSVSTGSPGINTSDQEPWPICAAQPQPENIEDPGPDGILDVTVEGSRSIQPDDIGDEEAEARNLYLKDGGNSLNALQGPEKPRLGLFVTKRWQPRRRLRVLFLNSGGFSADFLQLIFNTASTWSQYGSITFEQVSRGPAEIRISMGRDNTFWSYLGTDSINPNIAPQDKPSMNLGFTSGSVQNPPTRFSNIVLHEFGHALGLVHEHQTPRSGIRWIERQVIDDCQRWYGWNEQQARSQILARYSANDVWSTTLDLDSIMIYSFPSTWNEQGYSSDWRPQLSTVDRRTIGQFYPQ